MIELVVTSPFATLATGDRITDPDTIQAVLVSANARNVVKVATQVVSEPDALEPAPAAQPAETLAEAIAVIEAAVGPASAAQASTSPAPAAPLAS